MNPTDTADVNLNITIGIDLTEPDAPTINIVATDPGDTAARIAGEAADREAADPADLRVRTSPAPKPPAAAADVARMCDEYGPLGTVVGVLRHLDDSYGLDLAEAKAFLKAALRNWDTPIDEPNVEQARSVHDLIREAVAEVGPQSAAALMLGYLHHDCDRDVETDLAKASLADGIFRYDEERDAEPAHEAQPMQAESDGQAGIHLGARYVDTVTQFEGTATSIAHHLTGPDRVCLETELRGKVAVEWFDASRLTEAVLG